MSDFRVEMVPYQSDWSFKTAGYYVRLHTPDGYVLEVKVHGVTAKLRSKRLKAQLLEALARAKAKKQAETAAEFDRIMQELEAYRRAEGALLVGWPVMVTGGEDE